MQPIPDVPRYEGPYDKWHNGAGIEIGLYARSLHRAAKVLLEKLDRCENTRTAWDVCPIVTLYREAVQLQMKFLIDEGGRFLNSPTDALILAKTRSIRWLAQIVCQVIRAVKWESEFRCDGVSNLAAFSTVIAELETMEPVGAATLAGRAKRTIGDVPPQLKRENVLDLVLKLDSLLELLAATTHRLAATAQLMEFDEGDGPGKAMVQ